jgi:hypothetical protein
MAPDFPTGIAVFEKIITLFFHHRNIKYILPEGREKNNDIK